ncbi:MAG: SIS domain-containing protein [Acidimicrobiia bacterium]
MTGVSIDHPDSLGMAEVIPSVPEQIETALAALPDGIGGLPAHEDIEHVLVIGVGASAWVGDALAAIAGETSPVPIVVSREYELPGFVDEHTLAVVVSWSGDTEETVEAAEEAVAAGAQLLVVTSGGELAYRAERWESPLVRVDGGGPSRAMLGALATPAFLALEQCGLMPGARSYLHEAAEHLRSRRAALTETARDLGKRIGRTLPLVYGGGPLGAVAAQRWKSSLNENAKVPAFASRVPDLCHDEVAGWGQHGDVTRQVFSLVELRHEFEHPQITRRFGLVNELLDEVVSQRFQIEAQGDSALTQLFELVLLGDLVSLQVAVQQGVDPGPVPAVEHIIEGLNR